MTQARITANGFREYDGRWRYPEEINPAGAEALGNGLGKLMLESGAAPQIVLGRDLRSYSDAIAESLASGLVRAGIRVFDIGTVISPMAYFARPHLGIDAVAMVTASHNPNGWTGLKAGLRHPHTLNGGQMRRLRQIVLQEAVHCRPGGERLGRTPVDAPYLDDLCGDFRLRRSLKIVCATGNGTAGLFAPEFLRRIGARIVHLHTETDVRFPHYNPNPESLEMLSDMARNTCSSGADLAFGFDGDGDRLGIIDNEGNMVFADKIGLLLARSFAETHPNPRFIADIKSTGLYASDPLLMARGAATEYWKTGHSHIKHRLFETGALAAFEKSGHFYFGPPIGRGYDDALLAAREVCRLLDQFPGKSLSELVAELPESWTTPTMSPYCSDEDKYDVAGRITRTLIDMRDQGERIAGLPIREIVTVNGARCILENGSWVLVRASSNTPNLVVVCESMDSEAEMSAIFADIDRLLRREPEVGEYDQRI
ncbi:MAG: phosphomannomutase/phosphoglucomutase [Rhodobacteraceae bacterium]|nr:phosphomannomutase/phosphoglucomutase [Paracoccaceae bacterium]